MNFINSCTNACLEVQSLIQNNPHERLCEDISVGFGGDMSHFIDIEAEKIFISHLSKYGQIISEEIGSYGEKSENKIIIDPIDGSDNFISKVPYFGSSIALKKNGIVKKSFIVNFANGDIFYKIDKNVMQGRLGKEDFKKTTLNKNSSLGLFERSYKSEFVINSLKELNLKFRSPGAVALSLAYAKNVDFVLYEGEIRSFDVAAGLHMCEDLYAKKDKNFLFVSKDKQIFDRICKKLLKAGKIL